jgi:general secretion pathway protein L
MSASKIETYRKQLQSFARKIGADRFFLWWLKELSTFVPAWMRAPEDQSDRMILLELDASTVVLKQLRQGKWQEAARMECNGNDPAGQRSAFLALLKKLDKRPDEVGILLAKEHTLSKCLNLPLAVEENLAQVLGFEMDRNTPFKSDQVYFDYRITGRDMKLGQLEVQMVVAPRPVVDEMLAWAGRCGASVQGVWLADELSMAPPRTNLLPLASRAPEKSPLRHVNLALAALAGVLLIAALIVPVWQKRELIIRLMPLADRARQQAEATEALHRELDRQVAEYNHLLEKKQVSPVMVAALDELTRLLPDDTWVQQLDIKGDELQIQGETASSSQLVGLFEQSRILRDASFKSPLTKVQGGERFQLAAGVKPLPPPDAVKAKSPQPPVSSAQTAVPPAPPSPPASESKAKAAPATVPSPQTPMEQKR